MGCFLGFNVRFASQADLAREIKAVADFLGLPLTNKAVTEARAVLLHVHVYPGR